MQISRAHAVQALLLQLADLLADQFVRSNRCNLTRRLALARRLRVRLSESRCLEEAKKEEPSRLRGHVERPQHCAPYWRLRTDFQSTHWLSVQASLRGVSGHEVHSARPQPRRLVPAEHGSIAAFRTVSARFVLCAQSSITKTLGKAAKKQARHRRLGKASE